MESEKRDWITLALAAAGVVGAISLAGIFVVYLVNTIGDDGNSKPAKAARPAGGRGLGSSSTTGQGGPTGPTAGQGVLAQNRIPDDQRYSTYRNRAAGYLILAPKGWTKQGGDKKVEFKSSLNAVRIRSKRGSPPTVQSVRAELAKDTKKLRPVKAPHKVNVGGNPGVADTVADITQKNPVTNEPIRILIDQYRFGKGKNVVVVELATPGATVKDNADDYRRIASSFRWL